MAFDYNAKLLYLSDDPARREFVIFGFGESQQTKIASIKIQGSIWTYDPLTKISRKLPLLNLPDTFLDFHPHGISLLHSNNNNNNKLLLYVVNHRRDGDAIEVFDIIDTNKNNIVELNWKQSIMDNESLTAGNDVHAISEHEIYVTNFHYYPQHTILGQIEILTQRKWSFITFCEVGKITKCKKVVENIGMANGIIGNKNNNSEIFVAASIDKSIHFFHRDPNNNKLNLIKSVFVDSAVDNIVIDETTNDLIVGSHPKILTFLSHARNQNNIAPSQVFRMESKGNNKVEEIFLSNGTDLSASSVGVVFENYLFIGGVFDAGFLICTR